VKRAAVLFTEMAESDILEQADWYELQSSQSLAQKWHKAVTSTILRIIQILSLAYFAPSVPTNLRMSVACQYQDFRNI
jgi:plasmid stabilization system protein ParE